MLLITHTLFKRYCNAMPPSAGEYVMSNYGPLQATKSPPATTTRQQMRAVINALAYGAPTTVACIACVT